MIFTNKQAKEPNQSGGAPRWMMMFVVLLDITQDKDEEGSSNGSHCDEEEEGEKR